MDPGTLQSAWAARQNGSLEQSTVHLSFLSEGFNGWVAAQLISQEAAGSGSGKYRDDQR